MAKRLPVKLPVASWTRPMRYGPTNPPRFPSELINAIAPAAAVPLKNAVGSDQKTGSALKMPAAATERAIKPRTGV